MLSKSFIHLSSTALVGVLSQPLKLWKRIYSCHDGDVIHIWLRVDGQRKSAHTTDDFSILYAWKVSSLSQHSRLLPQRYKATIPVHIGHMAICSRFPHSMRCMSKASWDLAAHSEICPHARHAHLDRARDAHCAKSRLADLRRPISPPRSLPECRGSYISCPQALRYGLLALGYTSPGIHVGRPQAELNILRFIFPSFETRRWDWSGTALD